MKLSLICKSCQKESRLKEKELSRPELADKIGEEFSHRCSTCGIEAKYHVNQVTAHNSTVVKLFGTFLGIAIMIGVTILFLITGYITNLGLIIGAAVLAGSQMSAGSSNAHAFNSYRL